MTFNDIFKRSFLTSFYTGELSLRFILFSLAVSCALAVYVFFVYRLITRKTFYSKTFNISLAVNTVIVTGIILTIQSSIVLSLGMVGALSIVRFRTAIKDPLDLSFLFWTIAVGISCGAGLMGIAAIISVVSTVLIVGLDYLPLSKAPLILIVNASDKDSFDEIMKAVQQNVKSYHVKSQVIETGRLDLVIEVRTAANSALINGVSGIANVTRCSLLSHDGEVTF